ncbi:MAG: amidohydrolase family protein, partial [Bacillota bacterium]|nr:amidohydrolase family protein [Bacillota bacterium]
TIAGSATNLMDCMKNAVKHMGISLEDAVYCSTVTPARSVGIYDCYGSIEDGKIANLVLLEEETLETRQIFLRGKQILK